MNGPDQDADCDLVTAQLALLLEQNRFLLLPNTVGSVNKRLAYVLSGFYEVILQG